MAKERKRRKKMGCRIPKEPVSSDLRSREQCPAFSSPLDESGEYMGHRFEEIRLRVAGAYRDTVRSGLKVDYMDMVDLVLDEMGFARKRWERGAIYSALSRYHHAKRKKKRMAIEQKRLDEARQVELFHGLTPEHD